MSEPSNGRRRRPLSNEEQQAILDVAHDAASAMGAVDDGLEELIEMSRRGEER